MPETFQFLWKIRKARGEVRYGAVYLKGDSVYSVSIVISLSIAKKLIENTLLVHTVP